MTKEKHTKSEIFNFHGPEKVEKYFSNIQSKVSLYHDGLDTDFVLNSFPPPSFRSVGGVWRSGFDRSLMLDYSTFLWKNYYEH